MDFPISGNQLNDLAGRLGDPKTSAAWEAEAKDIMGALGNDMATSGDAFGISVDDGYYLPRKTDMEATLQAEALTNNAVRYLGFEEYDFERAYLSPHNSAEATVHAFALAYRGKQECNANSIM